VRPDLLPHLERPPGHSETDDWRSRKDGDASPTGVSRRGIGAQRVALRLSLAEHSDEAAVHRVGAEAAHCQPARFAKRLRDARDQDAR
jgi:hypothetical protein